MTFSLELPTPRNHQDFEALCRNLYSHHWDIPNAQLNGRSGHKQNGVDFYGVHANGRVYGCQLKRKEAGKALTEAEVLAEVEKAKGFEPKVQHFVIATTAKRDPELQKLAARLTQEHLSADLFTVVVDSWDDLVLLLEQYQAVRDAYYGGISAHQGEQIRADVATLRARFEEVHSSRGESDSHPDIDLATEKTKAGEFSVAQHILEALLRRCPAKESLLKFRALARLGDLHQRRERYEDAADCYFRAAKADPEHEDATYIKAVAYSYLDNREKSHELAARLVGENPASDKAWALWVHTASPTLSFEELKPSVPAAQLRGVEVRFALARRAAEAENPEAEELARLALELAPNSPPVLELLGTVLLQGQTYLVRDALHPCSGACDPAVLEEVEALFTRSLEKLSSSGAPPHSLARARLKRARAYFLLDRPEDAERDSAVALDLAPKDAECRLERALTLFSRGEEWLGTAIDEVTSLLEVETRPLALEHLLAQLLRMRGTPSDLAQARSVLLARIPELAEEDAPLVLRRDCLRTLVSVSSDPDGAEQATRLITSLPQSFVAARCRSTSLGWLALLQGNKEQARIHAHKAVEDRDGGPHEARDLALLFFDLEEFQESFSLFRGIVHPEEITPDTHRLLDLASRCNEDDFTLGFCADLRERSLVSWTTLGAEANVLEKYNSRHDALRVLQWGARVGSWTEKERRTLNVRIAQNALALNRTEIATRAAEDFPSVEMVDARTGALLTGILRETGKLEAALDFSYELLRRYPDEFDSHQAVILAVGVGLGEPLQLSKPSEVTLGTAVALREAGAPESEDPTWYVIEDSHGPSLHRRELGPEHSYSVALMGAQPGETVSLPGPLQGRTCEVVEIVSKYVFRWRECMHQSELLFPNRAYGQRLRIQEAEDGTPDLGPILAWVDQRAERLSRVEDLYQAEPLPLYLFGRAAGGTVFETVGHVWNNAGLALRCCAGTSEEWDHATRGLSLAKAIVLDESALATLFITRRFSLLEKLPVQLVVSEGTLRNVCRYQEKVSLQHHTFGTLAKAREGYVMHQPGEEQLNLAERSLQEFLAWIDENVEVQGGTALAKFPESQRTQWLTAFGRAGAESIALAAADGHVLWSDDMPSGHVSLQAGIAWTWSQIAFSWLHCKGFMTDQALAEVEGLLVAAGYDHVHLSPATIFSSISSCGWDVDAAPLTQVLQWFERSRTNTSGLTTLLGQTLLHIWRNTLHEGSCQRITLRLLDHVAARRDGSKVVRMLEQMIPTALGIDVITAGRFTETLVAWREGTARGALILPPAHY